MVLQDSKIKVIENEIQKYLPSAFNKYIAVYYVNTKGLTNETINTYLKILTDRTTVSNKYKITSEIKKGIYKLGGATMSKEFMAILKDERQEGIKEGRQEGIELGRREGKVSILLDMVNEKLISSKDAAKRLGMSEKKFLTYLK